MRSNRRSFVLLSVFMAAGACGAEGGDDLSSAVPRAEELSLSIPGTETGQTAGQLTQALIGERASLYTFTRETSRAVNGTIWTILTTLKAVTELPPTGVADGVAEWGPFTPALGSVTWRLRVREATPRAYAWVLAARAKADETGEFTPVMAGLSRRGESDVFSGYHGSFAVNAGALNAIDPEGHKDRGKALVRYDARGEARRVKMLLKSFSGPEGVQSDVLYRYVERADSSGHFGFAARTDIHKNGSAEELALAHTLWTASGAGRGQAVVTQGDVPAGVSLIVGECWDDAFGRTFYQDNLDLSPAEGELKSCALAHSDQSEADELEDPRDVEAEALAAFAE